MTCVSTSAGEEVIRQGDHGESFYVVDEGFYDVTIGKPPVVIMQYQPSANGGANPCFGELA
eukprot:CAMPEP_0174742326 /NCGR_PEP_ID=MMETSP1094-20130205/78608_1 /TAXON_ID=156173 /ORGANISM="Chrysochromulina brevifilum, Strain UTEX LB 985" /LENGTH=60 /DNA_ID=CAMNT_0015946363 /DNA_START=40 /DNA_END=218 /DNA_ORIENTATION=-